MKATFAILLVCVATVYCQPQPAANIQGCRPACAGMEMCLPKGMNYRNNCNGVNCNICVLMPRPIMSGGATQSQNNQGNNAGSPFNDLLSMFTAPFGTQTGGNQGQSDPLSTMMAANIFDFPGF